MDENSMKKIMNLSKQRGFIFHGSDIYGGLANTWDYGPLGVELKNNVKQQWWKYFVQSREDMLGLDSAILMHPNVWKASGHTDLFNDPMVDCKQCKGRFRLDHLFEQSNRAFKVLDNLSEYQPLLLEIQCPTCKKIDWTEVRHFNLMFQTYQGVIHDKASRLYLRPETAQGIFINFAQILNASAKKIPFGIAQIGKAFRNEITPGRFIFRTREFEQMEIEYFVQPGTEKKWFDHWLDVSMQWYLGLGIQSDKLRTREHPSDELSHYSDKTIDIEYQYPFGWGELQGIASRRDFDLSQHSKMSGSRLSYFDAIEKTEWIPYVIEPSFGLDRTILMLLVDAYKEEELQNGTRTVLSLDYRLAPIKIAIFPLKRNHSGIVEIARRIADSLRTSFMLKYDDTGSIGKLYRRQDEIGTPYCVTVDFQTLDDQTVTIRERDSMKQQRLSINQLEHYFKQSIG